ncbi:MAG: sulfurtransferase TusA family protein [Candidatus Marinimicrobia bacterium]|nr:sulfurtransferase TusA family protein [Candidatus Neomarinimicrobiota bacterium]
MAEMNLKGMKCPEPIMKLAAKAKDFPEGEMVEIVADCPSFPKDIEAWCERTGRTLLFCMDEGDGVSRAQVQF